MSDLITKRATRATLLCAINRNHAHRCRASRRRFAANLAHGLLIIAATWALFRMIGGEL